MWWEDPVDCKEVAGGIRTKWAPQKKKFVEGMLGVCTWKHGGDSLKEFGNLWFSPWALNKEIHKSHDGVSVLLELLVIVT